MAKKSKYQKGDKLDYTGMGIDYMNNPLIYPRNPTGKLANRLYNTIQPDDYIRLGEDNDRLINKIKSFIVNKDRFNLDEDKIYKNTVKLEEASSKNNSKKIKRLLNKDEFLTSQVKDDPYSEDAWATYLGLDQKNNTLTKSKYKPSISKDESAIYYKLPDAFKNDLLDLYKKGEIKKGIINENVFPNIFGENMSRARILGNFKLDEGEDEKGKYISYYDKYDLEPELPILGKTNLNFIGKPYEIYDRIYLDENKKYGGTTKYTRKYQEGDKLDYTEMGIKFMNQSKPGKAIMYRRDFNGNILSKILKKTGPIPKSSVINDELFDYWLGQPIRNNNLSYSKYRPDDETDKTAIYVAWNDPDFRKQVIQYYKENYKGKTLKPSYTSKSKETGEWFTKFSNLGNFKISRGEDEKGEFIQYYDVYDRKKGKPNLDKTEYFGSGKPYEIYDRIYLNENKKYGGSMKSNKIKLPEIKPQKKYNLELTEEELYELGGWLKGGLSTAGTGAAIGSAIMPGVGTAIGAGLGFLGGAIFGNKEEKEKERLEELERQRALDITKMSMPRTVGLENLTPNVMSFKKGGSLSASKAKKMLKEGVANGKKLTAKQKRYFGWVAGGKKEYGGEINDMMGNNDLMEIEGPSHEEGGIQFTPDAEVEGGETIYNNVVNSDSIKITKAIASKYGLPTTSINKTVAEYSKIIGDKYKDREFDPFAMTSKEMELNNIAKMSIDLAEQRKSNGEMKYGGKIKAQYGEDLTGWRKTVHDRALEYEKNKQRENFLKTLWEDIKTPFEDFSLNPFKPVDRPIDTIENINQPTENTFVDKDPVQVYLPPKLPLKTEGMRAYPYKINFGMDTNLSSPNIQNIRLPQVKSEMLNIVNRPIVQAGIKVPTEEDYLRENIAFNNPPVNKVGLPDSIKNFPNIESSSYMRNELIPTNQTKLPDIIKGTSDNIKGEGFTKAMGVAPLAIGLGQTIASYFDKPDEVHLGRIRAPEYNPELIDPSYQLDQIEDVFATGNEQISQQSKKDWLRRRIQSATEESKAKSGTLGQIQAANTQMLNRAKEMNLQNKFQADIYNQQIGMQESNMEAANKGALDTARSYNLSNLATMAGEYGRDRRMEAAQDRYTDRTFNAISNLYPGQSYDRETEKWNNIGPISNPYLGNNDAGDWRYRPSINNIPPIESTYNGIDIQNGIYNNYSDNYRYPTLSRPRRLYP